MVRESEGAARGEIRFGRNLKYVEWRHGGGANRRTSIGLVLLAAVVEGRARVPLTPQARKVNRAY